MLKSAATAVARSLFSVTAPYLVAPALERNSLGCLTYVKEHAKRGDPASVVRAIDEFAAKNIMMNIGDAKGAIVDDEIRKKKPATMVEIGAYTGYSAVRFASVQLAVMADAPSHYYSFEYSPVFAARVREMVAFAGLDQQVTVIEGAFGDQIGALVGKAVDIYFIDHAKELYVPDAKRIVASGTLRDGSLLIADNVLFPGTPEYLAYLDEEPHLNPKLHTMPVEQIPIIDDGVSIATYKA